MAAVLSVGAPPTQEEPNIVGLPLRGAYSVNPTTYKEMGLFVDLYFLFRLPTSALG